MSEEPTETNNNAAEEEVQKFSLSENEMWNRFSEFQSYCAENVKKINALQNALSEKQFGHEKEFRDYQATVGETMATLHKTTETMKREVVDKTTEIKVLTDKVARLTDYVAQLESENSVMGMRLKEQQQSNRHIEDRMAVSQNRQKVAELRQHELEMSVEYAMNISRKLRKSLDEVDVTKQRALQEQATEFEKTRKELMHYYETRESNSRQEFTNAVKEIQDSMALFLKGREAQLAEEFKAKVQEMQKELVEKEAAVERRKSFLENEYRGIVDNFEREKARWKQQHQGEYDTYMLRAKEREDWAMASVTAREKRLTVLEEQYTTDRGKWERETEERVLKKEEALRSQYETTIEEMRRSFEQERQKLSDTYLDQLQRITNLHAQNERELERMHREKERELGQPYKTSFVQSSTTPTEKEREQSFLQQSSLLSKFEMVEAKQNERAQKLKMAFGEKDSGSP